MGRASPFLYYTKMKRSSQHYLFTWGDLRGLSEAPKNAVSRHPREGKRGILRLIFFLLLKIQARRDNEDLIQSATWKRSCSLLVLLLLTQYSLS